MSALDLLDLPTGALVDAVRGGGVARDAATTASVAAAERLDASGINAFVHRHPTARAAMRAARDASEQPAQNGALAGVPVAIKDNLADLALPTTCGSKILAGYISPYEATAVSRLLDAGAVVVGKTNMDEFAMGSSTEHSAYGPTRNPIDPSRVPGGSSGGSAAAVAAGVVRIALGAETGGSVRQPAAFCGVVGVKPTYGRVSRHGLVAFASSLDQVGVFGRTVDDAALALEVVAGRDAMDATSAVHPVPSLQFGPADFAGGDGHGPLHGFRVGRPKEYFPDRLDREIAALTEAAFQQLRALGATVKDVSLPHTDLAIPVYYILAPAEASSNLARFDGVRYGPRAPAAGAHDPLRALYTNTRRDGFGPEVTRRILLGTYALSHGYYDAYYKKAQEVRGLIAADFARAFESVDLLLTPTTPTPAFRLGALSDPYEMYLSDIFTATANLAGVPAMSLPIGRVGALPVGGQLIAPHFGEATMFRAAAALERALATDAIGAAVAGVHA